MSKDPAFLFYPADFIMGTLFLTNEEIGIYIKLMCAQHQHGGLIEKNVFNTMVGDRKLLREKFVESEDGFFNQRLMEEMELRKIKSENLSANAIKGWELRRQCKSKAKAKPKHMPIEDVNEDKDLILKKEGIVKGGKHNDEIAAIVDDLNSVLGSAYRTGGKTAELIRARINEGFRVEDFKKVHRIKNAEWGNDPKMKVFLRPITLYSNKFENYLNQKGEGQKKESGFKEFCEERGIKC